MLISLSHPSTRDLGRGMETQDNGFLLVIDGVRKEKERLTAANLLRVILFLSFPHYQCQPEHFPANIGSLLYVPSPFLHTVPLRINSL